jgi:hypothetical protein
MATADNPELGSIDQAATTAIAQAVATHRAATVIAEIEAEMRAIDTKAESLTVLISRVATASAQEIERVIAELERVRDQMRAEDRRVRGEVGNYVDLSQAAMASMRVIGDSLARLKAPARDEG